MSTMTQLAIVTSGGHNNNITCKRLCFSFHINNYCHKFTTSVTGGRTAIVSNRRKTCLLVSCSAAKPSSSTEISSSARIRSEVLTPFRSVRLFFYIAFIAQASLGGLIATTQLIGALANPSRAGTVVDIAKGLGIDIGAAALFAFLYYREDKIKNAQMEKLTREENLSNLKLRVDEKKIITVGEFRGLARLVILAGPSSFINEAFKLSETFTEQLIERGVLVVPFSTDGNELSFEFDESEDVKQFTNKRRRLWQLIPVLTPDWSEWLDAQKKLANVSPESPV
nr:protein low PSII accumulation 1, chloroplastic [Tanacetum cinerariifolium]